MKPENNNLITTADRLVGVITAAKKRKSEIEAKVARRISAVQAEFTISIEAQDRIIQTNENALHELMVGRKTDLFGPDFSAGKRVDLPCGGALIASIISRAKRVKGVLDRLKLSGMKKLIKTVEKVDWDGVDALDDAILAQLGSKRMRIENFEYETAGYSGKVAL